MRGEIVCMCVCVKFQCGKQSIFSNRMIRNNIETNVRIKERYSKEYNEENI